MKFTTIVDHENYGSVRCASCGCQFDYDVDGEINLELSDIKNVLVLVCPGCGAK